MTSAYLYARFPKNNQTYSLRFKIIYMRERFYPSKRVQIFFRGDFYSKKNLARHDIVKIGNAVNETELFKTLKWEIAQKYNIQPYNITLKWDKHDRRT